MDITTGVKAFKTKAAVEAAKRATVKAADFSVGIADDERSFIANGHRVIFGNCLHHVGSNYHMWHEYGTNLACGDTGYWTIPDACFVTAVKIGVCSDGCSAWAVEIRC